MVGSEGVLGVIGEVTLRVRPAPEQRRYEGWSFRSFAEGVDAFRVMEQAGAAPDIARLSDEEETRMSMALASSGSRTERLGKAYLRARGHEGGCIAILGFEGGADDVERRRVRAGSLMRAGGALALGTRPGEAWSRGRYHGPYLRDDLLGRGVLVETLETATRWSNVDALHDAVREALIRTLSGGGTPPVVLCHVSHLYPSGASLYFTFLARQDADEPSPSGRRRRWRRRTRSWPAGARSPTTTPWDATTAPGWRPRWERSGWTSCAPPRNARSRRGDEPREAAAARVKHGPVLARSPIGLRASLALGTGGPSTTCPSRVTLLAAPALDIGGMRPRRTDWPECPLGPPIGSRERSK